MSFQILPVVPPLKVAIPSWGFSHSTSMFNTRTGLPVLLTFGHHFRYNHYRKYTHAYNIPIVSTSAVPDAALKRACYVVRFMLGDRRILRRYMYRYYGRVGIMGAREGMISLVIDSFSLGDKEPQWHWLQTQSYVVIGKPHAYLTFTVKEAFISLQF